MHHNPVVRVKDYERFFQVSKSTATKHRMLDKIELKIKKGNPLRNSHFIELHGYDLLNSCWCPYRHHPDH